MQELTATAALTHALWTLQACLTSCGGYFHNIGGSLISGSPYKLYLAPVVAAPIIF